jgi:hypothetical protein
LLSRKPWVLPQTICEGPTDLAQIVDAKCLGAAPIEFGEGAVKTAPAQGDYPVPAMPSAELSGRPAGAAACGANISYEYLVESMSAFATNQRTTNGDIPKFMQMLSENQREATARYLSAL